MLYDCDAFTFAQPIYNNEKQEPGTNNNKKA